MTTTELELLITVKAYPNPSERFGEAACIAGISRAGEFIRLYPIPFRDLNEGQQFKKYQWVKLQVGRPKNDKRPESRRPNFSTLEIVSEPLSTTASWAARRDVVMPLKARSMCDIQDAQKSTKASLGFFKPAEVIDIEWERTGQSGPRPSETDSPSRTSSCRATRNAWRRSRSRSSMSFGARTAGPRSRTA